MFNYYVSMVLFLVAGDNWGGKYSESTCKPLDVFSSPQNPFGLGLYSAGEVRGGPVSPSHISRNSLLLNCNCDLLSKASWRSMSGDYFLY